MAPELVVAGAPYKEFPGGVIAFRATDWIGSSATASAETDTRAIEGEAVRETQLTASTIRTAELTAFQNADDTLAIDMTGVPIVTSTFYAVFVSVLIEGDWDSSSAESRRQSTPVNFKYTARLGMYGDTQQPDLTSLPIRPEHYPRNAPHYTMLEIVDDTVLLDATDTLYVVAFGGPSSTIEWLIDQVVLVPEFVDDFSAVFVDGSWGIFQSNPIVDGADGGDSNGKFTWHPKQNLDELYTGGETGGEGGGDYQQSDSEYMIGIVPEDGWFLTVDPSNDAFPAHAYSLHGAYYREDEMFVDDSFTRTHASDWGQPGGGYDWNPITVWKEFTISTDGSRGRFHLQGLLPRDTAYGGTALNIQGSDSGYTFAEVHAENLIYSGEMMVERTGSSSNFWDGSTGDIGISMELFPGQTVGDASFSTTPFAVSRRYGIEVDPRGERWRLMFYGFDLSGWIDISSWFALQVEVGFKIEVRRHRIRARVWEASGSEPSTWDFDDFIPIHGWPTGSSDTDWDYSDDPLGAKQRFENLNPGMRAWGDGFIAQWDVWWDNIRVEYDGGGSIANVNALIEKPEGTERGRIEVPSGAWHFVYWGLGKYTGLDAFLDPNVTFSSKVWSDAGAADLQRAEAPLYWFRAEEQEYVLVSMNWRSGDRQTNIHRIHVGQG